MSTIEDVTEAAPSEDNTDLVYAWAAVDDADEAIPESGNSWKDRLTWAFLVAAVIVTAAAVVWFGWTLYRHVLHAPQVAAVHAAAALPPPSAPAPTAAPLPPPAPVSLKPGPAAAHEAPPPEATPKPAPSAPPLMPYDTPDDAVALGTELCSELDEWGGRGQVVRNIMSPPGGLTRAQAEQQVDAAERNFCPRNLGR